MSSKASQGGLPRGTQGQANEGRKRPVNSNKNKHANDLGKSRFYSGLTLSDSTGRVESESGWVTQLQARGRKEKNNQL